MNDAAYDIIKVTGYDKKAQPLATLSLPIKSFRFINKFSHVIKLKGYYNTRYPSM